MPPRPRRSRGQIEPLPSGSLRVKVYAGIDPVTKKRLYLDETVPAGRTAAKDAEKVRTRLLAQLDERRNPKTRATVDQLLDRYFEVVEIEPTTRSTYLGYARNHIRPVLGDLPLSKLDSETIESFYAQLRTCRSRCGVRRASGHTCRPMAAASVRQIDAILSGACARAVRWKWISVNPVDSAEPPAAAKPNPLPPTTEQAARISTEAWKDSDWGMLVWLAMMTGARRGELCALAWDRMDFATGILTLRSSIASDGGRTWEKDTKSHQQRRITLDPPTVELLRLYRERCREVALSFGSELADRTRMFSRDPDGQRWLLPDSVSQRYERMCRRLGWDMNIHQLRHYSATELIGAGVDLRTVAGRLGHSGQGATTLRYYTAFLPEADSRAATTLGERLPTPPGLIGSSADPLAEVAERPEDASPYQRIAADLLGAITCGALAEGDPIPTLKTLATKYSVAIGTAQRAVTLLAAAGHVTIRTGHRTTVSTGPPVPPSVGS